MNSHFLQPPDVAGCRPFGLGFNAALAFGALLLAISCFEKSDAILKL